MPADHLWDVALVAATAGHAGFQLTVSCLVYPALSEAPTDSWARVHQRHSRRIVPLVGVVYLALLGASADALGGRPAPATVVAVSASVLALGVTALAAAPLHRRLAAGRDPALIGRLLRVDKIRTALALVALVAALCAVRT